MSEACLQLHAVMGRPADTALGGQSSTCQDPIDPHHSRQGSRVPALQSLAREGESYLTCCSLTLTASFIQHERGHTLLNAPPESVPGTSIGSGHTQQAISTLEYKQHHTQHKYKDISKAQMRLQDDSHTSSIEMNTKSNKPQCVKSAQVLKAAGTSSDNINENNSLISPCCS